MQRPGSGDWNSTYDLVPGLIRRVQIAVVQVVALYGVQIWWQGQKSWCEEYQGLINRQGRTVTGMFRTALKIAVVRETGLRSAVSLLNN